MVVLAYELSNMILLYTYINGLIYCWFCEVVYTCIWMPKECHVLYNCVSFIQISWNVKECLVIFHIDLLSIQYAYFFLFFSFFCRSLCGTCQAGSTFEVQD